MIECFQYTYVCVSQASECRRPLLLWVQVCAGIRYSMHACLPKASLSLRDLNSRTALPCMSLFAFPERGGYVEMHDAISHSRNYWKGLHRNCHRMRGMPRMPERGSVVDEGSIVVANRGQNNPCGKRDGEYTTDTVCRLSSQKNTPNPTRGTSHSCPMAKKRF